MKRYSGIEDKDKEKTISNLLYSHFDDSRYQINLGRIRIDTQLIKLMKIRNISQHNNLL